QLVAIRRIGQEPRLFVQRVERRRRIARDVALADVAAVQELHEIVTIRIVGDPAVAPHLVLAGQRRADLVAELALLDVHADADGVERLFPQLLEFARGRRRLTGERDHERLSVGPGAGAATAPAGPEAG